MKKVFLLIFIFAFIVLSCENPFVTAFLPEIENAGNAGNAGDAGNTNNAGNITGIAVKTQPALLSYTHGGMLDLSGLVVTVTYSDTTTEDAVFADFGAFGITTAPADGAALSRVLHDGNPVTVRRGNELSYVTNNLSVAKAEPDYTAPSGLTANYGDTLASVALPNGWEWDNPASSSGSAGVRQHYATFTPTDTANYNNVNIQLAVTVMTDKKATGIAVKTQPALFYTHGGTLDLSGLVVTVTFSDAPAEDVAFADFAAFDITTVPANGSTLSRALHDGTPVTVTIHGDEFSDATDNLTVAKADPDYTAPTGLTANYGDTLASVALPNGWEWDYPAVSAGNVGNNQHYATFTPADAVNYNNVNIPLTVTVKGPQTVSITFNPAADVLNFDTPWDGYDPNTRTITVSRNDTLILALDNPDDYTDIEWLLRPDEGGSVSGMQGHIFTFTPPERFDYTESEVFTLTLRAGKDGALYNRTIRIISEV